MLIQRETLSCYLSLNTHLHSERSTIVICHAAFAHTARDTQSSHFLMVHAYSSKAYTVLVAREIYIVLIYSHGCFCHGTHLHVSNERYTQLFFVSQLTLSAHIYWSFTLTRHVQFWLPLSSHMLHSSMMISKYHDNMKISRYHDDIKISSLHDLWYLRHWNQQTKCWISCSVLWAVLKAPQTVFSSWKFH